MKCNLSLFIATLIQELFYFFLLLFVLLFKIHLNMLQQQEQQQQQKNHIWSPAACVASVSRYLLVFYKLFL